MESKKRNRDSSNSIPGNTLIFQLNQMNISVPIRL